MSRILVIDDEVNLQKTLALFLAEKGHQVRTASSAAQGLDLLSSFDPRVVILDLRLPDASGLDILGPITARAPSARVIVITAYHDMETTISAMRRGAFDYLHKPLDIDELEQSVARAAHRPVLSSAPGPSPVRAAAAPNQLVGRSRAMRQIFKVMGMLTTNQATVLIQGETGTGKEVTARAIHERCSPQGGPFVTIDCATLVDNLMESELFGHERGAFTGAVATKKGRLELASSGTIFFDEIGELSLGLQAKLLRFLERREFTRVGGLTTLHSSARVMGATNRSLEEMAARGTFRPDLLFRLKVATLTLPPLRERLEDMEELVPHFLERINKELGSQVVSLEEGARGLLRSYHWPGNVRELLNVLTKAVMESRGPVLLTDALRAALALSRDQLGPQAGFPTLAQAEKSHLEAALRATQGNITAAALLLGITRPTLRSRMVKHGLERKLS